MIEIIKRRTPASGKEILALRQVCVRLVVLEGKGGVHVRFEVTPILAEGIRMSRIQNGIASKDVAAALHRSPTYISKLERGDIKTIDADELTTILQYVIRGDDKKELTLSEKLEILVSNLAPRYGVKEIERELWLENYDWIICEHPVPPELPATIAAEMKAKHISVEALSLVINSNAELPQELCDNGAIPLNQWKNYFVDGTLKNHIIKLSISLIDITDFLEGKRSTSNYLLVFVIVRFLRWLVDYPEEKCISDIRGRELYEYTVHFLDRYNFSSNSDKRRLKRNVDKEVLLEKLRNGNVDLTSAISKMPTLPETMPQEDIESFFMAINRLFINLDWDQAFMRKLISLPFSELEGLSYSNKRQLLSKIEDLIQSYKDLPIEQKRWETYD